MKGLESLTRSYNKQKDSFEDSKKKRVENRQKQIDKINQKISNLQKLRDELIKQNKNEKEFESFESFRIKSEKQFRLSKESKKES